MAKKYMVGYCFGCNNITKQQVLECTDTVPMRVFETVFTLGFGLLVDHDYYCECTKCGEINTLTK